MSKIIFRLKGVSDDEATDVREILTENNIDYYETSDGMWGVSMPALWLKDETQLEMAQQLIERYQQERVARVREEYEQLKREGKNITMLDKFKEDPVRFTLFSTIIIALVYLSVKLFVDIAG